MPTRTFELRIRQQVTDHYGHDAGDATLRAVSETLAKSLRRPDDVVGRWGGEEFLVLLSDVNATLLHVIAERSRALVEKSGVLSAESRVPVTISIGATLIVNGDSAESVIKRADQLMYVSKSNESGDHQTLCARSLLMRLSCWRVIIGIVYEQQGDNDGRERIDQTHRG